MTPQDINQTIEVIKTQLTPLADKLGQTVAFTYEIMMRQAYLEAIVPFATSLLVFIVCLTLTLWLIIKNKDKDMLEGDTMVSMIAVILCCVVGFIALIVLTGSTLPFFTVLANPHYATWHLIIKTVKQ